MKHLIKSITAALFILLFTSEAFATGAGVQLGAVPGLLINQDSVKLENFTGSLTGTMKFSRVPVVVGAGLEGGKLFSDFDFGLAAFGDYWFLDLQLINTWSFYSGFGLSGKLLTANFSDWNLEAGARFFAGMNYLLWDGYLELYAQQTIVPTYICNLKKVWNGNFMLCLPVEAGVRMHF